jgi:glycosyltransferase involved in cell wall biosynthesis
MLLGKPVVATAYGGNMDFMDDGTAFLVPASSASLDIDRGPYARGSTWAEPDHEAAVAALRAAATDTDRTRSIALAGQHRAADHFASTRVLVLMLEYINEARNRS